jgi:molybdopterin-guanine dinucleotide biosynthesis protein A
MTPCVILAGGRSSRMGGGDKCLMPLMGQPMLAHVLDRVASQCGAILINSNSDPALFRHFGSPVAADATRQFQGPLAGLLAGLSWARTQGEDDLLSVACDTPFLPHDLLARLTLARAQSGAEIAIASDHERSHPVIGLWPATLVERLEGDLASGTRAMHRWLANFHVAEACFNARHFRNINTPTDLLTAGSAGGVV